MASVDATRIPKNPAALIASALLLAAAGALTFAVVARQSVAPVALATLVAAALVITHRALGRWHVLVGVIVLIIMFIPIERYKIAAELPFDLEPYRIVLAMVVALWIGAALIDSKTRLRRSFLDKPLLLILVSVIGSILTNIPRIGEQNFSTVKGVVVNRGDLSADALKKLLFLISFLLFFYVVVSVVRDERTIHNVIKTLVTGAAIVAFSGIVEARTGFNVFDHVEDVFPVLNFQGALSEAGIARGGRLRVYASAQHPIALATMLVMVLPLALYLIRHTGNKRWALASTAIGLGAISTVSRTSVTALATVAIVFGLLRPREMKRFVPLLLPMVIVIHLAVPGAIGGLRQSFFPAQGLIQDQTAFSGRASGERLRPELERIGANPAFGQGYGTRLTDGGPRQNARVLDNEWLGTTSETGLVGLFAWLWLFCRFVNRAGREAKRDLSSRGWLLAAMTASVTAFAVSMLTFDAFSFIQGTVVLFIIAALASCTLATSGPWPSERRRPLFATASFRRSLGQIS